MVHVEKHLRHPKSLREINSFERVLLSQQLQCSPSGRDKNVAPGRGKRAALTSG